MSEPSDGSASQPRSTEADALRSPAELSQVRGLLTAATHRLLGDTISVSDDEWRAPSRLPGWSRGHVASHIARQADALGRLVQWARTGQPQAMYDSEQSRDAEIDAGASRSGLDLQIDLDTSAGGLEQGFDALDVDGGWDREVELRGGKRVTASSLPLARLGEVSLHHVDLQIGFDVVDIDPEAAAWLLEWSAFRLAGRDGYPALRLEAEDGGTTLLGPADGEPRVVRGSAAQLLGWLSRRLDSSAVEGADDLTLPPY
jgi:maleylpyruvate isomerase